MLRIFLLALAPLLATPIYSFQSCDDSPGLLSMLLSNDDEGYDVPLFFNRDTTRTENFEIKFGVNVLLPNGIKDVRPVGVELAFYQSLVNHPKVYVGGAFSLFNYGFQSHDTLFSDYDEINTFNNIYGMSFLLKHRVVDTRYFKAFVGFRTGLFLFHTYSKAVDTTEPCEEQELGKTLHSITNLRPSGGPTLDVQVPLKSIFDRINVHIGYRMTGRTTYIRKQNVDIQPSRINYTKSVNNLNMLSFQIGFSHFF